MRKTIVKMSVFVIVFLVTLIVAGKYMNKGHENITIEMSEATLPVIYLEKNGEKYNLLHGYSEAMDIAFQRDVVTVLDGNRESGFIIKTFGNEISGLSIEVRSLDGSRLIEKTEIGEFQKRLGELSGRFALKDLIEKDTEYALVFLLELGDGKEIRYYTRVIWSENLYFDEKLDFVKDFHNRLYDKDEAREITKYLETNSQLEDNKSFHKVNIHSSFKQITWGDLYPREELSPNIKLVDIKEQTASVIFEYYISTGDNKARDYYRVEEYFRVRYTPDRMYLLDYERTMEQIPDTSKMYANDKILLGITDENVQMRESEDGNIVAFEAAGELFSYNITTNRLAVVYSFFDRDNADARTLYNEHAIKILDIDEGGNVSFAVYGYMNRGRHEGEIGIELYSYNYSLNTIEEIIYIPYDRAFDILDADLDNLLYLNREQKLYLSIENCIYCVDLAERTYEVIAYADQDGIVQVSQNHSIMLSLMPGKGDDINHCSSMSVRNLNNESQNIISVKANESIRPLGFMGEDIIYGVARNEDIVQENTGRMFFPMYKVCISDSDGNILKVYSQTDIYITGCVVAGNQITLKRMKRLENGEYTNVLDDHITNNMEIESGKNIIAAADIDIYERYVQIKTKGSIDTKNIKVLTPKEVVFEGGRNLQIETEKSERYYVYGAYGVSGIYISPASAVDLAYNISGTVIDSKGICVWYKGNRVARNQIMAIKAESVSEERSSMAVCLDTMLGFEGITKNTQYLLNQGHSVVDILENNLEKAKVFDMSGCNLDSMLYYVNQDIPVLALLRDGSAVLVVGFNEYNVVIMEPARGELYKKGMNDAAGWFEENGNNFITYVK